MGIRQDRKIRRKKAEEEIIQAIEKSQKYFVKKYSLDGKIRVAEFRKAIQERISEDTKFRFTALIDYYMNKFFRLAREDAERREEVK